MTDRQQSRARRGVDLIENDPVFMTSDSPDKEWQCIECGNVEERGCRPGVCNECGRVDVERDEWPQTRLFIRREACGWFE